MTNTTVDTSAPADATQNNAATVDQTTATTTTAAENPATGNVLDTSTGTSTETKSTWPDDWRDRITKGDESRAKFFSRYASPEAALDALVEANKVISKHKAIPQKPGKDAKPEEVAAYRASLGVPDKPEAYFDKLPNGLVIGDDDKPLFEKFAALMHEENVPTGAMQKVVDWYYKEVVEEGEQQRYEANREAKQATEDALRQEYGAEYRAQVNGITNLLNSLPDGAGEVLANAVGPDGVSLFNNPAVVRAMVHLVNEINPTASVIPGGSNPASITSRLGEIKEMMLKEPKKYWSEPIQAEELRLMEAQQKLQARG